MSLEASVQLTLGRLRLEADGEGATGELVVLLGPNGAGKTTLLCALAGLIALERGRVALDGMVLDDTTTGEHVPAEQRPVGFVFQDYLLFPHLSSLENVAFGLRARGVGRAEARRRAAAWLDRAGPAAHAGRGAGARGAGACVRREPLPARAPATRTEVRRDLRRHLASFDGTRLLV